MKRRTVRLEPSGLFTNTSGLLAPKGALSVANNVVIDRPGIIESRRGQFKLAARLSGGINRLFEYEGQLIAHYNNNLLSTYNGAAWAAYVNNYSAPDANYYKIDFVKAMKNLYFTTSTGPFRLSGVGGIPERAGMPIAPGFDRTNSIVLDATAPPIGANWLATAKDVAYRAAFFKKDGYNRPMVGTYSGRFIFTNGSGSTRAVKLRVYLPKEIQNSSAAQPYYYNNFFVQLFRSSQVDTGTGPSDNLQQVYEKPIASADVTNGYIDISDIVPDDLRQDDALTNQNEEGIEGNRLAPPLCKCMAWWKNRMWFGSITGPHSFELQLIAVLGNDGVQNNETILLDGVTYTGVTGAVGANQYKLESTGSAAQNIERTALNLCEAINKSASNSTVYAIYDSNPADPLTIGRIFIVRRTPGGAMFNPRVGVGNKQDCWQPSLPTTGATNDAIASEVQDFADGVMFSPPGEPDAILPGNLLRVGEQTQTVQAMVPLGDHLFVFKADGVFIITDLGDHFDVRLFDPTVRIICRDSAKALANEVFLLCDQGVVAVSPNGSRIVSKPVEKSLLDMFATQSTLPGLDMIHATSFAIAYETDRKYILFFKTQAADAQTNQAFVYNVHTKAWTKWQLGSRFHGFVDPADDLLYTCEFNGVGVDSYVYQERKARNAADFVEPDGGGISKTVTFVIEAGSDPMALKHFSRLAFLFDQEPSGSVSATVASENNSQSAGTLTSKSSLRRNTLIPPLVSRARQIAVSIQHSGVSENFALAGIELEFRDFMARGGR